ncbi:hypothetical protein [Vibrio cincinnatiensis]|uniref:hypothetical protein n=1 Tax=Vibrio cincinnatiensis TaxID=675 RepID=UPI001EDD0960|nr:hypothetical protein [Vibrio cincinnatiensis]MCG3730279.1 hypothetical protein [Vibrio cincinnatiensis]
MVKRLCKLNRHDIRTSMGEIQQWVIEPKYVCGACARSSSDKSHLCKPQALKTQSPQRPTTSLSATAPRIDTPSLILTKKTRKKQKKYQKKLAKVLKKQRKLMKKQQALQRQFTELNLTLPIEELNLAQFH